MGAERIRNSTNGARRLIGLAAGVCVLLAVAAGGTRACILDIALNGASPKFPYLFPNWKMTETTIFDTVWCSTTGCPGYTGAFIRGLTIQNYGTATGNDITDLYFCMGCSRASGGDCSANQTMTYAGIWANGKAAWTWAGTMDLHADPCNGGPGGCACIFVWHLFIDIAPCPTDMATVKLGPGYNDIFWLGGVSDAWDCYAPWGEISDPATKTIVYAVKTADQERVSPGDLVNYTIYYGRPGNSNLSNVVITDTQPAYTHYIGGSGIPPPDFQWDPNPGPPPVLRWTIPPPHSVATGGTGEVRFTLSVDWGNGEGFEPGSGDVAAPEGIRLNNQVLVEFVGSTCPFDRVLTAPTDTVVRRFLFWKIGDNDILFSPIYGQSPDEIIYSIFLANVSSTKTWWNVHVWDTVPTELSPWAPNCGFFDACVGWTMTPTGCSPAYPGNYLSGGETVLTWTLDMPPKMTLELRYKAIVKQNTAADTKAINRASIMADGKTGIVEGTGHSIRPSNFTHLAPIVLPTTYISYVAYAASGDDNTCPGFFIDFFPLNKRTQFELRGIQYQGAGWSTDGGVSESIGCLIGDCVSGFPGNSGCTLGSGGIPGGGIAGCKTERIPAMYEGWTGDCPTYPQNFIYKLTSNSPVLWQLLTNVDDDNQDTHTYAPATTLTYAGLMHYCWRRHDPISEPAVGYGDSLSLISTSADAMGVYTPGLATTVHLFMFDYLVQAWQYRRTYELDVESTAVELGTLMVDEGAWRIVSSDARLIVNQGFNTFRTLGCCCSACGDNYGAYMPTRETGNVVAGPGAGTFYGIVGGQVCCGNQKMVVGNVGVAPATYDIYKYVPVNTLAPVPMPPNLNGSSGSWVPMGLGEVVAAGQGTAGNPQAYWGSFNPSGSVAIKIVLRDGGPIQILHGVNMLHTWGGGAVLHASDGNQTGMEFWFHYVQVDTYSCKGFPEPSQVLDVFCPKTGMVVECTTQSGYNATNTTTGPDQCVAFEALSQTGWFNYVISVTGAGTQGDVITLYSQCKNTEKGYTAPFLQTGTHYRIITPPVVFSGEIFWITIVVVEQGGGTKTDYVGTTSFTSTDPSAEIASAPMNGYDYTWVGGDAGVKIFLQVTMTQLGLQTIVAQDILDGSITGVTAIMVVGVDVKLTKRPPLTVAASGDVVPFQICFSNYSSASATNFVITDRVPNGVTYVQDTTANHLCGATKGFSGVTVAYSTTGNDPNDYQTMPGAGVPNATWLRWTIPQIGVGVTGCVCFKATID